MTYRRPIAVADCESDPFKFGRVPAPFIWGFWDDGFLDPDVPYREFSSAREMVEFLRDKEYIVYVHNGGKFDYHYMLDYIEPFDDVMIINGRLAKFHIGICEFRDSYNIIPVPLAEYQKTEIDYGIFEANKRYKPENLQRIRAYLQDDCRFLFELVSKFVDRFGLQMTQAGASMRQWQKISGIKAPKASPEYHEEFKPYYYGGRCECFEVGLIDEPFEAVDIRSAYPFAMLSKHPYFLDYSIEDGDPGLARDEMGPAFYKVSAVSRGAFPYRDHDGSLWFPRDDEAREYHITGWELLAALDTGTVEDVDVLECRYFTTLVSFAEYVHKFYNERKVAIQNGDAANKLFGKLFMNSLYGKYAMNPDEFFEYLVVSRQMVGYLGSGEPEYKPGELDIEYEGTDYQFAGEFGPNVLARAPLSDEKKRYYNIATAASVTGFVRGYLWRAAQKCGGLIYMDTDCITARRIGDLDRGPDLGQWTTEGEFTRGAVAGKKLYVFKYRTGTGPVDKKTKKPKTWKLAHKGVKLNARQILQIARGGKVTYHPEVPTYSVYQPPRFVTRDVKATGKTADTKSREAKLRSINHD